MDALDLLLDFVVTPGTGRPLARVGKAGSVFMVGGRGDRQFAADQLDTQRLVVAVDRIASSELILTAEALLHL